MSAAPELLRQVLEESRSAGFLGPGPVEAHLRHAEGLAEAAEAALGHDPDRFVDLGTGGGVPGLVLARRWKGGDGVFVDSNRRRGAFLSEAVIRIGLEARIEVVESRAEAVARDERYREMFEVVSARSFAGSAVTAEIAAGLVRISGVLVVSEPPEAVADRWPSALLAELGFGPATIVIRHDAHYAILRKERAVPDRFPRGVGRPDKRPLW